MDKTEKASAHNMLRKGYGGGEAGLLRITQDRLYTRGLEE